MMMMKMMMNGIVYCNSNKIQRNDMEGGLVQFCLFSRQCLLSNHHSADKKSAVWTTGREDDDDGENDFENDEELKNDEEEKQEKEEDDKNEEKNENEEESRGF